MALEEDSIQLVHVIISLAILLFAAKLFAELFHRLKLPTVLGELLAGILVGPFAIGGLVLFEGEPLVLLDETIRDIGGIVPFLVWNCCMTLNNILLK
jgi:Kef-type K+ transport system membrane component KefB